MTNQNVFALRDSGLNDFLFSDVGTELNGSELTMLSILARLGLDPWAEAARLAKLPKAEALDSLNRSIGAMALGRQAGTKLATAASRLILLLPEQTRSPAQGGREMTALPNLWQWMPLAVLCACLAFAVSLNMMLAPVPNVDGGTAAVAPFAVHTTEPASQQPNLN